MSDLDRSAPTLLERLHWRTEYPPLAAAPSRWKPRPTPRPAVLVVEDEQNIRELVCLHLGLENYDCVQCGDGESALKLTRSRHFDLVILDVMLPGPRRRDRLPRDSPRLAKIRTCRS